MQHIEEKSSLTMQTMASNKRHSFSPTATTTTISPTSEEDGQHLSLMQSNDQAAPSPDVAVFVQDLLDQMQARFSEMGDSITGKMKVLGKRMDDLDQSVNELMDQAGLSQPPGTSKDNGQQDGLSKKSSRDLSEPL